MNPLSERVVYLFVFCVIVPLQCVVYYFAFVLQVTGDQAENQNSNTVEALVSDHIGNSEKWAQLKLVAYENGLS